MKKLIPIALLSLLLIQPPAAEAGILRKTWTFVAYLFAGTVAGPVLGTVVWAVTELDGDSKKEEPKQENK